MSQTTHKTQIVLSFGLIALTLCACCLIVVGERVAPRIEQSLGIESYQASPMVVNFDELRNGNAPPQTLPVNSAAASEMKKQADCIPCQLNRPNSPVVQNPTPVRVTAVKPTQARHSLSIFVGTDAQSQALLSWFNNDPQMQKLKSGCDFQAYGTGNALYKSRYAATMPAEYFPAIIFADSGGGHIYVATKENLPKSASDLWSKLRDAYQIQKKALASPPSQQSQSQSIPTIPLITNDPNCPDGRCPTPPLLNPNRGPLLNPDRDRSPLFPDKPQRESLWWVMTHPLETVAILACVLVGAVLLLVIVTRVLRS